MSEHPPTLKASSRPGLQWAVVPSLFAMAPLLSIYASNADQLQLADMLTPMMLAAILCIVPTLLAFVLFPKNRLSVLALCSALSAAFFYYGHAYDLLADLRVELGPLVIGPNKVIAAAFVAGVVCIVLLNRKGIDQALQVARVITVVGLVLAATSAVSAAYATTQKSNLAGPTSVPTDGVTGETSGAIDADGHPDIYFIVLDAYASNQTLLDVTGYDNARFTSWLENQGFYVAEQSVSNYATTFLSLAATLNMDYVNEAAEAVQGTDRSPFYEMIHHGRAVKELRAQGYQYIHLASGWGPTNEAPLADVIHTGTWSELNQVILETTALRAFGVSGRQSAKDKHGDVLDAFAFLESLPESRGPKFVFAHLLVPHAPYVFGADGTRVDDAEADMEAWDTSSAAAYVGQLMATNAMTMSFVDRVMKASERPAVIVLQGDLGLLFVDESAPDSEASRFRQRHSILNAMYLPDVTSEQLHSLVSPVNTFRIIFDQYLGTDLGLLEDRAYHSYYDEPYELTDVTAIVSASGAHTGVD